MPAWDASFVVRTMIEPVTDAAPRRKAFYQVFNSRSPVQPAGRDEFPVRALLYPTDCRFLEGVQFRALMGALEDCGEREFYLSMVEFQPERRVWGGGENNHWLCRNPTFDEYEQTDVYIENALYSVNGSWGVLLSHEDHALVVCHEALWQSLERRYPDWRKGYDEFIDYWKEVESRGVNVDWINPFLSHLTRPPAIESNVWRRHAKSAGSCESIVRRTTEGE